MERIFEGELAELSTRAANALFNNGITTRQQLRDAVKDGKPITGRWRGVGKNTLDEVLQWADIPRPSWLILATAKHSARSTFRCPHCQKAIYVSKGEQ